MYLMNHTSIRDFENMLKNHRFAATVDNPSEFRYALKQEANLQRIALKGDPRYVDMFYQYQREAIAKKGPVDKAGYTFRPGKSAEQIHVPNMEEEKAVDIRRMKALAEAKSISEFIKFRDMVRNFDWDYNKFQDRERYNAGKQMLSRIREIAKANGGAFQSSWETECKRRGLNPFGTKQRA